MSKLLPFILAAASSGGGSSSSGIPSGGTTGQVLTKNSDADYDTIWSNISTSDENSPYIIDIQDTTTISTTNYTYITNSTDAQSFSDMINYFYTNNMPYGKLIILRFSNRPPMMGMLAFPKIDTTQTGFSFYFISWRNIETFSNDYSDRLTMNVLEILGSWSNNLFTANERYDWIAEKSIHGKDYFNKYFLSKTNTSSYTPTRDYNPATKKYVDDAISSAITTTLGGSF